MIQISPFQQKKNLFLQHLRVWVGLGTDRASILAAGPETAGYQYIFQLAGFCRTGTGCLEEVLAYNSDNFVFLGFYQLSTKSQI